MATWIEPVFDRIYDDVLYAIQQLSMGINNAEYKGCFNPVDINRIENNTRYLSDELNSLVYCNSVDTQNNWTKESTIYEEHITRIIGNISHILDKYFKPPDSPTLPGTLLTYEQVNNLEKNLHLLKEMLDNMKNSFKRCGTFNCGEE